MSDDMDVFINDIQTKSYRREKQDRFEQKVLLILLRGLEASPGAATRLKYALGEQFDLIWLMQSSDFPVRLMSFKSKTAITLPTLVKWPERTTVYKELQNARESYGDTGVGIIFASDGDQMPEMVMHDMTCWTFPLDGSWRIELKGDLILEPLKGFIQSVKFNSGWELMTEQGGNE